MPEREVRKSKTVSDATSKLNFLVRYWEMRVKNPFKNRRNKSLNNIDIEFVEKSSNSVQNRIQCLLDIDRQRSESFSHSSAKDLIKGSKRVTVST